MSDRLEIQPASLAQVQRSDRGDLIAIDDDVHNVARDLKAIDSGLKLEFDTVEEFFVVSWLHMEDGQVKEKLVLTARDLDQRIVERVRRISLPDYDYVRELERIDREADRRADHEHREQVGPYAERLRHALRKDLGLGGDRAVIPRGI